jgi:adenylate kinase family enzyme
MKNQLICLVGRHGSGKSSFAQFLARKYGWRHICIGLLKRLSARHKLASGVPAPLLFGMRREKPGEPLSRALSEKLLLHAASFDICILDGFPATKEHVLLLPDKTILVVVAAPKPKRRERLIRRSRETQRKWATEKHSPRDVALPEVIASAKKRFCVFFVHNAHDDLAAFVVASDLILQLIKKKHPLV